MNGLRALRILSYVEGCSLLVLLFIAMPLKHIFGWPLAVRMAGSLHGVLFLALASCILQAKLSHALPSGRALRTLAWALVPFGFLEADRACLRQLDTSSQSAAR